MSDLNIHNNIETYKLLSRNATKYNLNKLFLPGGTTPAASVHGSDNEDEDEVDEETELAELRIN